MENTTTQMQLEELVYAGLQRNLVYNFNFLYYSNAKEAPTTWSDYGYPDGWVYTNSGANALIGQDQASCRIYTSSDVSESAPMTFTQALHEFPRFQETVPGNFVSARVCMNVSAGAVVSVTLQDDVGLDTMQWKNQGDAAEDVIFEVILEVDAMATVLELQIKSTSPNKTLWISTACANIGKIALENLPCVVQGVIGERKQYISTPIAPAEELSLCVPSAVLPEGYSRLDSVLNGKFGRDQTTNRSLLPDVRGSFTRAWNNGNTGASSDPDAANRVSLEDKTTKVGDVAGSWQEDQFASHNHSYSIYQTPTAAQAGGGSAVGTTKSSVSTEDTGGKETRSKNFYELYTIKWA